MAGALRLMVGLRTQILLLLIVVHIVMKETHGIFTHMNIPNYWRHLSAGKGATFPIPAFAPSNTSIFNGALTHCPSLHPLPLLYAKNRVLLCSVVN